jgi:hypothetical protein
MKEESLDTKPLNRRDYIFVAAIIIILLLLLKQCNGISNLNSKLDIQNHNLDALSDSIRIEKDKVGDAMFVKKTLLADKASLEKLNKDLALEVEKVKGQVLTLQKISAETRTRIEYVPTYITKYADGQYSLDWKFDTTYSEGNYRKLSASSFFEIDTLTHRISPGQTRIGEDAIGFSFVTGLREKNKSLEIFVTPKYPGMTITSMEGAIIDPQKSDVLKSMFPSKKWSVGPYVGVGIGAGKGLGGNAFFGPVMSVGLSLQYSLIKF